MARELLPPGSTDETEIQRLEEAAAGYKPVLQIIKKQKDTGLWGTNLLGTEPNKDFGIKEPGTVARYRQLLEMGMAHDSRPHRLANRALYRVLSKDPDPDLLFEYKKAAKGNEVFTEWARDSLRSGVVGALAHGGERRDPRVRGAAKRMADRVSAFLRSDLADDPLVKSGSKFQLHPDAHPPTINTFVMTAYMPHFRRERAGLLDRLVEFVGRPNPGVAYTLTVGDSKLKPTDQILGDPLELGKDGKPKDIPFALQWIELLARTGVLEKSETACQALAGLLDDCDEEGVWNPRGLRSLPKSQNSLSDFAFPLQIDPKTAEQKRVDVTFRLALIAKLCGWELDVLE